MPQNLTAPQPLPFDNIETPAGIIKAKDIPLPHDWNIHIKRGILAIVALAHRATVELYRRGHESVHPLFRHLVKLHRTETHAHLLDQQLQILKGRAARGRLGFYTDEERFSVLQIQMARGWSHTRTAREFLHCARTIALWHRVFESGRIAGPRSPVNKFPDCVRLAVLTLKRTFPNLGHRKIAEHLARAGLALAASTAHRILKSKKKPDRPPERKLLRIKPDSTQLVARYPGHIWHCDITSIPAAFGAYFSWWPTNFPRILPTHRHVVAVIDSFSREVVAIRSFGAGVTAAQVVETLNDAIETFGSAPGISSPTRGPSFTTTRRKNADAFLASGSMPTASKSASAPSVRRAPSPSLNAFS